MAANVVRLSGLEKNKEMVKVLFFFFPRCVKRIFLPGQMSEKDHVNTMFVFFPYARYFRI